jgi:hypothetical protein
VLGQTSSTGKHDSGVGLTWLVGAMHLTLAWGNRSPDHVTKSTEGEAGQSAPDTHKQLEEAVLP